MTISYPIRGINPIALLLLLAPFTASALGQATPTASVPAMVPSTYQGFQLPRIGGNLQFALSVSEILSTGFYANSGTYTSTSISGDVAYLSPSKTSPFTLVYSGGYLASTSAQSSSVFQNLSLSQAYVTRSWNFIVADSVSYLPETPSNGLSGIPGVGDLGVAPIQVGNAPQGILTGYASRVTNSTTAGVGYRFTGSTSLEATGTLLLQRFVGDAAGTGFDSTEETASIGPNHRIDARNNIGANYVYTQTAYPANQFSFVSQSVSVDYSHQFTRKLAMDVSVGPQRTSSSTAGANGPINNVAASLGLNYVAKETSASANYSRGTNNGFGVIQGAVSDNVHADARRMLNRVWFGSVSANYSHTSSLSLFNNTLINATSFSTNTFSGGLQVSRAIGNSFSAYASYTAQHQSIGGSTLALNPFSGLSQIIGIGLTYSPASLHLGQR